MELNKKLETLLTKIDEVGKRPAYMKGGSLNDKLEYERLRELFLDECLNAFRSGLRFSEAETKD